MFDNLWADLKKIIAAVENPSVDSISEALKAAGSLLQNGWDLFKDLFGKRLAVGTVDSLAACKAMVADHEAGGGLQAAAPDGSMLLNILALIRKFLELFGS